MTAAFAESEFQSFVKVIWKISSVFSKIINFSLNIVTIMLTEVD